MFVFSTYLPVFLLKFWSGELFGCRIWFCIQQVPTLHTFDGYHYPKKRNTWKNVMMMSSSCFLGISCFWGRRVRQNYVVWELVWFGIKLCIQRLPTRHTFDIPHYPKNKKYLKNMMMMSSSRFSGISCFWGSGVHEKYAVWVLVGCGIKIPHPTSSPDRNFSKNTMRYVENTNKKSSFF